MMKKFVEMVKQSHTSEDGSELMQFAIIIVIVAGLAVLAYGISDKLKSKMNNAANVLDGLN